MDGGSIVNVALLLFIIVFTTISLLRSKKMKPEKRTLCLVSLASTVLVVIIPDVGYKVDEYGYYNFGMFTDFMTYRGDWMLSLNLVGLLVNFYLFYWIYKALLWMWKMTTKKVEN